jgi:hypothetical protein
MLRNPAGERRPSCSPKTTRNALRPAWRSSPIYCAKNVGLSGHSHALTMTYRPVRIYAGRGYVLVSKFGGIIARKGCSAGINQLHEASLILACKGCGAEVKPGTKFCRVCGISKPASLLRASIIRPTALVLVWLALLLIAYRFW